MSVRITVIGGSEVDAATVDVAESVGRAVADRGHTLVCGGLGGVMAAACRGARGAGGTTIGILPGDDPAAANDHVEVPIATGLGDARNALVVLNGRAVIVVDGSAGTLSEIGHALVRDRPIAGLDTFDLPGIEPVASPAAALEYVESAAR